MSRTVVLGATGFVGRALVLALQGAGHEVSVLARDPARAAAVVPAGVDIADVADDAALDAEIARADAVVNLAGESIAGHRWTARRKRTLIASRVDVTERLVRAIGRRDRPLSVLVSASATGWYGDRGDEILDDTSPAGDGFAADLCRAWEAAARTARADRVVVTRFGVILGRESGALAALRRVYRMGLGGPIGNGLAWMPWIHLGDAVRAILHVLEHADCEGPVVVTAPCPIPQRAFARVFARLLGRPAMIRTPVFALRLALGEASSIVTASQRVEPRALLASGFAFRFSTISLALEDLVRDDVTIERARVVPDDAPYLQARGARYLLRATTELAAPIDEVFEFFSAPENLHAMTPPTLGFSIATPPPIAMARDALIDYRIRVGGLPLRWRTQIADWQPGRRFVDTQLRGPYRSWWHEHRFVARGDATVMEDRVYFSPPFGPIGKLFVAGLLRRIFGFRAQAIRTRFDNTAARHVDTVHDAAADHAR